MILLIHITIALSSAAFTFYTYLSPNRQMLKISEGLIAGTVLSGTVLVIELKTALVRACLTGLVFVGLSLFGIIMAQRKLAAVGTAIDEDYQQ
jgi:hypothetical protein